MNAHERIRRALRYMELHLDEPVSLAVLADISMYAPHHFHHVFRGLIGEGVAEYQRRLKMQRAAGSLLYSNRQIIDIALQAGYGSQEAFTRAFKRWSGFTPKHYRKWAPAHEYISGEMLMESKQSLLKEYNLTVEVKTFPEKHVASMRYTGDYHGCGVVHEQLGDWAAKHDLFTGEEEWLGLCYDDPKITPAEKCRYDACITVPDTYDVPEGAEKRVIEAGRYATILHKGSYSTLYLTYAALLGEWLPQSGEELTDAPCQQVYLKHDQDMPEEELLTEIRVELK
ncbi:AraC family transcriptional regulator [Halodesulfovibrio spirochaetisodalis]|uniref:HTH araC/xylS-type domain-containing protein n=1 Tax=Halodesulfovibrio spirochaetisodalis TaxID=1560234 RepID=A0A1B7XPU3_9BACT|nr:GyrI-like domain-containing protein [Halodesulfovibrio spirochaetisodalis]OBQ57538.1 hypothetical protein SP90_00370 [Halodesulfovibrio spirochaetisodalis]